MLIQAKKIENSDRVIKEIGKVLITINKYDEAIEVLKSIPSNSFAWDSVNELLVIAKILLNKGEKFPNEIVDIKDESKRRVLLAIYLILNNMEPDMIKDNIDNTLSHIIKVLDIILKTNELVIFEKALQSLNYIKSDKVLIELAKLYYENNFTELAREEVLRSIKEFGVIDNRGSEILYISQC